MSSRTPFRMFADFTGADPRFRETTLYVLEHLAEPHDKCLEDAAPAWQQDDPEPLRAGS